MSDILSPRQLKALVRSTGCSQRSASVLVGIHERTMRKYLAGEYPAPVAVVLALRYLALVRPQ